MKQPSWCRAWRVIAPFSFVAWIGCGGEPAPVVPEGPTTSGFEAPRSSGMKVEGLMGVIPERKIHGTLEPKLPTFQRCFYEGSGEIELLAGAFEFYFRVGHDGRVEWVYPRSSTVGHRGTEQCLLREAARTRFPAPKGGDAAELAWGFELDPPEGVRPPVKWTEADLGQAASAAAQAVAQCGEGPFEVTVYVGPGGQAQGAGVASRSQHDDAVLDCVAQALRETAFPDPGSYPAKVSWTIP